MVGDGNEQDEGRTQEGEWDLLYGPEHCSVCGQQNPFVCGCAVNFESEQEMERREKREKEKETRRSLQKDGHGEWDFGAQDSYQDQWWEHCGAWKTRPEEKQGFWRGTREDARADKPEIGEQWR